MERVLEMLIEHVEHAVAERPQKKQRADQSKHDRVIPTVLAFKHLGKFHSALFLF